MSKGFRFPGFHAPNYTQVPDELFDQLLPILSGAELKVLLYIVRRTFGFKKASDRISKSQLENGIQKKNGDSLDGGTGLSRRAIRLAVDALVDRNILLKHTHTSAEKGHETAEYALNVIGYNPWVKSTQGGGGVLSTHGLGYKVPTQETVGQETVSKSVNVNAVQKDQRRTNPNQDALVADTVSEILHITGDAQSTNLYRRFAKLAPRDLIYRALSETKVAKLGGEIRTTPGAFFTARVKELAKERAINLGLKPSRR